MPVAEGVVQSLIRNDPAHRAIGDGRPFELTVLTGEEAFKTLHSTWAPGRTFEAYLDVTDNPELWRLADGLFLLSPILVGANRVGADLVVFEGCHRIAAIWKRAKDRKPLPPCVGVFVAPPA